MSRPSLVHCELDLEANGKLAGYLRVPHSVHRSAYGWLPVPIVSIRNGDGARVLLMAGNHGDEYEGQVALAKMARWLAPQSVHGQVIILPMANLPAAQAGRRTSPVDGGNLNRSFPGDPNGGPTAAIAHYIESVLLPRVDVMVDVHSGGSSLNYIPCVLAGLDPRGGLPPLVRTLCEAFSAPLTLLYPSDADARLSVSAAARAGIPGITTELGGGGTLDPTALSVAEQGLARVLSAHAVLKRPPAWLHAPRDTRYLYVDPASHYCHARDDGLFEPLVSLGDEVRGGESAGLIHHPETPLREPDTVRFEGAGIVVCQRVPGRCRRGDCLFHLASDRKPTR